MVRTYKKKTNRAFIDEDRMQEAVLSVTTGEKSLRDAAATYGITHTTLYYRLAKIGKQQNKVLDPQVQPQTITKEFQSKYASQQVFSKVEEVMLEKYILDCSKMQYGMTYKQIRVLAFDYAIKLNLPVPKPWLENKMAGTEWMKNFMKRHNKLSLRKPENTSLSRATSFNITNVSEFFDNYASALQKCPVTADRIFNLDETGVTTVQPTPRVVAGTGVKQVGQAVSAERGTLVTMCAIVSASGNTIPPVYVFPRARFKDIMLNGAVAGSLGLVNNPQSGWMTGPLFLKVVEHIQKHTRCTKEDPVLLMMDNHESHCTLEVIMFCQENGITLLTFPPHCTHRLQPLDVGIYGPFKKKLSEAFNDWMLSNPGRTVTIYDIAGLSSTAYRASFTLRNILSAFRATGIWPVNRGVFTEDDFVGSSVTDRPAPPSDEVLQHEEGVAENQCSPRAGSSRMPTQPVISPEDVRPFPKAPPRKGTRGGRVRVKSRILTDTPEKNKIEEARRARDKKRKIVSDRLEKKKEKTMTKRPKCAKALVLDSSSSGSDQEVDLGSEEESSSDDEVVDEVVGELDLTQLKVNDFVLTRYVGKKSTVHYVGRIEDIGLDADDFQVRFLRRKGDSWNFVFPDREDVCPVGGEDFVLQLPQPNIIGGTERAIAHMTFSVDISQFVVK